MPFVKASAILCKNSEIFFFNFLHCKSIPEIRIRDWFGGLFPNNQVTFKDCADFGWMPCNFAPIHCDARIVDHNQNCWQIHVKIRQLIIIFLQDIQFRVAHIPPLFPFLPPKKSFKKSVLHVNTVIPNSTIYSFEKSNTVTKLEYVNGLFYEFIWELKYFTCAG